LHNQFDDGSDHIELEVLSLS